MAKKLMIMPSGRSRYVKSDHMHLMFKMLIIISALVVLNNYVMFGFMYALKFVLMIVVAYYATREMEILFYSHDKDISREDAKELIEQSYWRNTSLLFVLLVPVGTPLWLTAFGAVIATLLGKLLFGGFHHMVFHTSLVGYLFLTEGWPNLVKGAKFTTAFDNYIINLVFNNEFFNSTLSITSLFGFNDSLYSVNSSTALASVNAGNSLDLLPLLTGWIPGITASGVVLIALFSYLVWKKAVNYILPLTIILSFSLTALVFNGFDFSLLLGHLFSGAFLFVVLFITTDPITTPIETNGKIIFGVIAGALTYFIRNGSSYEEGVVFAVLFMMMLTPLLNTSLKKKKAPKKVTKVGA